MTGEEHNDDGAWSYVAEGAALGVAAAAAAFAMQSAADAFGAAGAEKAVVAAAVGAAHVGGCGRQAHQLPLKPSSVRNDTWVSSIGAKVEALAGGMGRALPGVGVAGGRRRSMPG